MVTSPDRSLPCAVYTRQSVRTEGDLTSCEVQREICSQFARSRGLRILPERFDDEGISGATLDRPALNRLLSLVRTGRVSGVVVHRLDRLSRRVVDCTSLLEEFRANGVQLFIAAMPELAGGAAGTLMLNVISAFAEFERDMIASRIRDSRVGLIARGRRIAGVVPFGYAADPRTKQLMPVPAEAAVVKQLYQLIVEGVLPKEVARIANEHGWRTRNGRAWTARQVLDTVGKTVYTGRFRTEQGTRPGTHEAIITEELFDRCAAAIAARRTSPPGTRTRRKWSHLEGKVRCARCGRLLGIRVTKNGARHYIYFRCRTSTADAQPCTGTQVRAYGIEETVRSVLLEPGDAFPRKRGRPTRAVATLYSLGQLMPLLDPAADRALIREVIQEVVWNPETDGIRLSLNLAALARGFQRPLEMVMSVCTPGHEYPRQARRLSSPHGLR